MANNVGMYQKNEGGSSKGKSNKRGQNRRDDDDVSGEIDFTMGDLINLTLNFCETLNTPLATRLYYIAITRDWPKLYELRLEPGFSREDVLVTQFLKKFPFKHADLDPQQEAVKAFLKSEEDCLRTNLKFESGPLAVKHQGILWRASQIAARILEPFDQCKLDGHCTDDLIDIGLMEGYAGNKATVGNHGPVWASLIGNLSRPSVYDSHADHPTGVGESARVLLCKLYSLVGIRDANVVRVSGSKVDFVPKTGQTHRSICIEPTVNLFFQAGLGRYVRSRLLHVGIDLKDQSYNQKLAMIGARTGAYATVDLSSASDSISYNLAAAILPPDWMAALDLVRTPVGFMPDGKRVEFEKLSSMGNGFTFPIETLLFYSLAKACAEVENARGAVTAYGDDIIVPSKVFSLLCEVLNEFGFCVNEAKSFSTGPYRESCGYYAYGKTEIRPIRIVRLPKHVTDMFRICNAVLAEAYAAGHHLSLDLRYRGLYRQAFFKIPKKALTVGPIAIEPRTQIPVQRIQVLDSYVMDPFVEVLKPSRERAWLETQSVQAWVRTSATLSPYRWESSDVLRTMLYRQHMRSYKRDRLEFERSFERLRRARGKQLADLVCQLGSPVSYAPKERRRVTLPAGVLGQWKLSEITLSLSALAVGIGWR